MKAKALECGRAESVSLGRKKYIKLRRKYFWALASVFFKGWEDVTEIVQFNLKLNKNVKG